MKKLVDSRLAHKYAFLKMFFTLEEFIMKTKKIEERQAMRKRRGREKEKEERPAKEERREAGSCIAK